LVAWTHVTVIATYYILFAVMGSSTPALIIESAVAGTFLVLAVAGFKKNLWLVVAALAGHGVFDFFHPLFIHNPWCPNVVARLLVSSQFQIGTRRRIP
jgi:hypothetical protein